MGQQKLQPVGQKVGRRFVTGEQEIRAMHDDFLFRQTITLPFRLQERGDIVTLWVGLPRLYAGLDIVDQSFDAFNAGLPALGVSPAAEMIVKPAVGMFLDFLPILVRQIQEIENDLDRKRQREILEEVYLTFLLGLIQKLVGKPPDPQPPLFDLVWCP